MTGGIFLIQDAIPTLVEVKRSKDTRLRREVVGQMLDYAANAVAYWPVERLLADFEKRCEAEGRDPEEALAEALGEEVSYPEFWQQVKTNLLAKRIRLLFVANQIPPELRRVVEFLNETMDPVEVLAVEIRQYRGAQLNALVPRVIGQLSGPDKVATPQPRTNREAFLATWELPCRDRFVRLLEFAERHGLAINWGTKGFSMNVVLESRKVSILEGYPPGVYQGSLVPFNAIRGKVADPEPVATWYREQLLQLAAVSPTGKGLRCEVAKLDEAQERRLHEVLEGVAARIGEHGLAK